MASLLNWLKIQKKSVISVTALDEQTRDGINKAYIPKFLYKPPYGYPRFANMGYIRYLAQTPYVEMCIDTILKNLSSIDWEILPTKGMEDQADEAEIEQIRNFFDNPNTNTETFSQVFIEMPVRDMLEINSGILNKVYNMKEELVEIVARDGATFTKNPNVHGMYTDRDDIILPKNVVDTNNVHEVLNPYVDISGAQAREKAAYFQYGWIAGPVPIPFGKKEIIWIEGMKRTDDHYGWSPVQILAKNLQMLVYSIESDLEYFNDNNVPKGIIGLEDSDSGELDSFKTQWNELQMKKDEFGNMKKMMNKVPIVNKVPKFERIEFSSSEMEIIEKQKWYTKMVWASFGVTATELGYTEDAKGSANMIVQSKVFRKKAINPILRKLEALYTINIISEFEYWGTVTTESGKKIRKPKYEFVFKKFDVDEERQKYELYKLQSESGIRTINEIRSDEGFDEVEWGDQPPSQWMGGGNNFNVTNGQEGYGDYEDSGEEEDLDGEDGNVGQDPENDVRNRDEPDQKGYEKKKQKSQVKAQPVKNPLILGPNEKLSGYKKLETAIRYVLKNNQKELIELVKKEMSTKTLNEVKSLDTIIAQIKNILSFDALKEFAYRVIKGNYMDGFEDAEKDIGINLMPDQNAIDYISSYTYDNIKGMTEDIANNLRQVMQRGFMDGSNLTVMKEEITKVFDVGQNRAEMIARTESNRAANFGRLDGYKKSGAKGKKVFDAHLDNRTSELCKRLNGQERELDEDFVDPKGEWSGPTAPAHVNCRSGWFFRIDSE